MRSLFCLFSVLFAVSANAQLPQNPIAQPAEHVPLAQECSVRIYGWQEQGRIVVITRSASGFRYSLPDGRTGGVAATGMGDETVSCGPDDAVTFGGGQWPRIPLSITDTRFDSGTASLAGQLIEPVGADTENPLVVYAHGSEELGWIESFRDPFRMAVCGVSVFVYDKGGTGQSGGVYSQNFPRLADDLVAASNEARRLAAGRFGRFGLIGLSQGGWIAPLAAGRARADFIGIGYGLVVDILEEDAS